MLFTQQEPKALTTIDILNGGRPSIRTGKDIALEAALADDEMDYLVENFGLKPPNPHDIELYMFLHKQIPDIVAIKFLMPIGLLMAKNRINRCLKWSKIPLSKRLILLLSAYKDNAAVMEGSKVGRWFFPLIQMDNIVFIRRCTF